MENKPNFGRFDTESKEEKEAANSDFWIKERARDRNHNFWQPIRITFMSIVGIAIILGIILAILVGLSGIPKKIDASYPAIMYRENDTGYVQQTTITMQGKLYTRWFSNPKFVGTFSIDQFELMKRDATTDIEFQPEFMNGAGLLSYSTFADGKLDFESVGMIWMADDMKKVNIGVFEPVNATAKSMRDLVISAPATTREEAVELTKQFNNPFHN
ncbi:hypothetical protein E0485_09020 [Paenibacillus albiflavus]|uniref:Uncharacterized protein n=1 Tax=Paenibacillus albiflavus TaxID=2545760 RepID=A0A4V2WP70_9BACL|nr:hypothetical protein [Paenibacillus albiflavus]TCZ78252.1 hypothetical protein E0485_09020 [Paenibacillus albiflavus]